MTEGWTDRFKPHHHKIRICLFHKTRRELGQGSRYVQIKKEDSGVSNLLLQSHKSRCYNRSRAHQSVGKKSVFSFPPHLSNSDPRDLPMGFFVPSVLAIFEAASIYLYQHCHLPIRARVNTNKNLKSSIWIVWSIYLNDVLHFGCKITNFGCKVNCFF